MIKCTSLSASWKFDCSPEQELGRGSFADVYLGLNRHTQQEVAIKKQRRCCSSSPKGCMLHHEYKVYQELGDARGIPRVFDYQRERYRKKGKYRYRCYMIMERLGPSLHKAMHHRLGKPRLASSGLFFSLGEVVSIGNQMISALRLLHSKGLVHRDVQPGNIVYDFARKRVLLIDYGAAQRYRNTKDPRHSSKTKPGKIGSPIFTSLSSHRGETLSRRDDLESLGYVLVYLFHGQLPWQHLGPQANDEIFTKKSSILTEDCCERFEPFNDYFQSVKRLSFQQTPDYAGLQGILEALVV